VSNESQFYRCESNPDGSMTIKGKLDLHGREIAGDSLLSAGVVTNDDVRVRTMGELLHNLDHFGYGQAADCPPPGGPLIWPVVR
jgi:hypothetical protein